MQLDHTSTTNDSRARAEKRCTKCGDVKPDTTEFFNKERNGRTAICKLCARRRYKEYYESTYKPSIETARRDPVKREALIARIRGWRKRNWKQHLLHGCRFRSRRYGLAFDLTIEHIGELFQRQKGRCFYSGIPLRITEEKRDPLYPSVDRKDSSHGYVVGNVVLSSTWMNFAKNDRSTSEFMELLRAIDLTNAPGFLPSCM